MPPVDDGASPAPIDRAVLASLRSRLVGARPFESAAVLDDGNTHLRADLSSEYYPDDVAARLEIRWYRNDDFAVHYRESHPTRTWECRWDRHPNTHNARAHFHPPPTANRADAADAAWPSDHREVGRLVLDRIEDRIDALWER